MTRLWAVARFEMLAAAHRRIFYLLLLGGGMLLGSATLIRIFTLGPPARMIQDLAWSEIGIFVHLLGIVLALHAIPEEVERKFLYPVITRPVSRCEYLGGKYLGILGITLGFLLFLSGELAALLALFQGSVPAHLAVMALGTALSTAVTVALVLFLSLSLSANLNFVLTCFILVLGHFPLPYVDVLELRVHPVTAWIVRGVKLLLPEFSYFNLKDALLFQEPLPGWYLWGMGVYGVAVVFLLLSLAYRVWQERDL